MSLIGLNIVFGIIVDTFAELRDERVIKLDSNFNMLAVLYTYVIYSGA